MLCKSSVGVVIVCVLTGVALAADAPVPQLLNYQGKLNDADGAPIEGDVTVGLGFYDTEADGNPLYSEEQTVTCAKGIFHALIGNGSSPHRDFAAIHAGDSVWLEITVDPQGDAQVLTPRRQIVSVVFALKSGTVQGLDGILARLDVLEQKLQTVSYDGSTLLVSGANLHIVNGTGTTETANGLGNLIVGYNELREGGNDDRSGSHNIAVGKGHNFSSYGGLVAGDENTISGSFACIAGGQRNSAGGNYASVSGGIGNMAIGEFAWAGGGSSNSAIGGASSISSGYACVADGVYSSVNGGRHNTASGQHSSVSGGQDNIAGGDHGSVGGGSHNIASGDSALHRGGSAASESSLPVVIAGVVVEASLYIGSI